MTKREEFDFMDSRRLLMDGQEMNAFQLKFGKLLSRDDKPHEMNTKFP